MVIAAERGVREEPRTGDDPINVESGLAGPTLGPPLIILGFDMTWL